MHGIGTQFVISGSGAPAFASFCDNFTMNVESKNVVHSRKTRAVFSNVKADGRSGRGRSRSRSAPRAKSKSRPRSRSAPRVRLPVRKMPVADRPLLSASTVAAAKAVMGTMYPAKYRNVAGISENINTPVTPITITDRYVATTITDAAGSGSYSLVFQVSPTMTNHFYYSTTFASGLVSAQTVSNSSALTGLSLNVSSYCCTGMEVRVEPNVASSAIQGEWAMYNYPTQTLVGYSAAYLQNDPSAARGFYTDADPSARYIWVRQDELDDNMVPPGAGQAGTAIVGAVVTASATPFVFYVTTTWTCIPNIVGRFVMPGTPVNIDEAAYRRGMQVFGDMVDENTKAITSPVVADSEHPGILRRVAYAIASTVGEARLLMNALMQATALGSAAYSIGTSVSHSLFGDTRLDVAAVCATGFPNDILSVIRERTVDGKCPFPDEVVDAIAILVKYRITKTDKRGYAFLELVHPPSAPALLPKAVPRLMSRGT